MSATAYAFETFGLRDDTTATVQLRPVSSSLDHPQQQACLAIDITVKIEETGTYSRTAGAMPLSLPPPRLCRLLLSHVVSLSLALLCGRRHVCLL
jgi:hypothetical protein